MFSPNDEIRLCIDAASCVYQKNGTLSYTADNLKLAWWRRQVRIYATSCRQCTGARESPDLAGQEARPWLQTDMRGMWQPPPLPQPILTRAVYGSRMEGGGSMLQNIRGLNLAEIKLTTVRVTISKLLQHNLKFYIRGSVHRNSRLKKSNEIQQYVDIYLLLNYSTCFGRPSRPSSGVHKTVVSASGTDHTIPCFLKRDQIIVLLVTFGEACFPDSMICIRGCKYSFMYSWWWARWAPETCRVI